MPTPYTFGSGLIPTALTSWRALTRTPAAPGPPIPAPTLGIFFCSCDSRSVRQWTLEAAQGLTSSSAEASAGGVASSIDAGIGMFR
jgi:hypothetical protein